MCVYTSSKHSWSQKVDFDYINDDHNDDEDYVGYVSNDTEGIF